MTKPDYLRGCALIHAGPLRACRDCRRNVHASSSLALGRLRCEPPASQSIGRDRIAYRCVTVSSRAGMTPSLSPISAIFFLSRAARGRCSQQCAERPSTSCTSTEAETRGLPSLCRSKVRLLRSKYHLAARQTLYTSAKLTVEKLLDTRYACRPGVHMVPSTWLLPMATDYDWFGDAHCNGSGCNENGRSRPTVQSVHAHLYCHRLAWVLCHRSRIEGQNYRFLKLIAIVTVSLS